MRGLLNVLIPRSGGSGGTTGADATARALAATALNTQPVARVGVVIPAGGAILASDTLDKFENQTSNPITITGTTSAALAAGSLTMPPSSALASLLPNRVTANQALADTQGYRVLVAGLTLTAPAGGTEFTVANMSGGTLRIAPSGTDTIGGETDYIEYAGNGVATFSRVGTDWEITEWSVGGLDASVPAAPGGGTVNPPGPEPADNSWAGGSV